MTIKAVFFDLGGVIARTENPEPRSRLASSLGLTYADIDKLVFENESSKQASLGIITEKQHWQNIARLLNQPDSEIDRLHSEFFAGDRIDFKLVEFMRSLHPTYKVGLISNAWSGLRAWIEEQNFADAFDNMVISAEVGLIKPDQRIYQAALQNLQVHPEESVFVDDLPANIDAARKMGMQAIHFKQAAQAMMDLSALLVT